LNNYIINKTFLFQEMQTNLVKDNIKLIFITIKDHTFHVDSCNNNGFLLQ